VFSAGRALDGEMKSTKKKNIEEYANRSTIHGISYIFDTKIPVGDRFLWFLILCGSCALVGSLIFTSFTDWQNDLVITTLKNKARPVTDLVFPALTICASGPHMGMVEKVLYRNFEKWRVNQSHNSTKDDDFVTYMREEFQIMERGDNILDILSTMIAPSSESSTASGVLSNQLACAVGSKRRKRSASKNLKQNKYCNIAHAYDLGCAYEIVVDEINESQDHRLGLYTQDGTTFNGAPVYRNSGDYLYYSTSSSTGWAIGTSTSVSGIKSPVRPGFIC
jgi:hypothetical protein